MSLQSELESLALALEREIPLSQSREMYVRSLANANHARRLLLLLEAGELTENASVQLAAS